MNPTRSELGRSDRGMTVVVVVELFCALALLASPTPVPAGPVSAPPANAANQAGAAQQAQTTIVFSPGVDEVLKLLDAGVDQEVVKTYIEHAPVAYQLSAAEIITLHERGVPSDLLAAMLHRGGELRAWAASAPPTAQALPAVPAPPAIYTAPVVSGGYPVQAVYPAYPYEYPYAGYEIYPWSSYVSVGFGWGWPWYGYGWRGPPYRWGGPVHRSGWPVYDHRYGRAWSGYAHAGPWNSYYPSCPVRYRATPYAAPRYSVSAARGQLRAGPARGYAAPRYSVSTARVGYGGRHFSGSFPSVGRGSFPSAGRGGAFHRGR